MGSSIEKKFFVYGSFCEGFVHYNRIKKYVTQSGPAVVQGSVYQLEVGFPVFLAQGSCAIEGQVVTLKAPEVFFQLLDQFHGFSAVAPEKSLYWLLQIEAEGLSGKEDVFVYALNPAKLPRKATLIEGGDWRKLMEFGKTKVEMLSASQKDYIEKLGKASRRDMIPIDMDVYRELVKMDLIVDKGRRLALTKFGKEVLRYLS